MESKRIAPRLIVLTGHFGYQISQPFAPNLVKDYEKWHEMCEMLRLELQDTDIVFNEIFREE